MIAHENLREKRMQRIAERIAAQQQTYVRRILPCGSA